jgi:penicillin amidase
MSATSSARPVRFRSPVRRATASTTSAVILCVALLVVSIAGFGTIPGLGRLLNPGTGVWADARGDSVPANQVIHVPGISTPTTVGFESNGIVHIKAGSDADMFRAIGYSQGRFRIFQMDLMRRQANGTLAQILGPSALASDEFELDIGLRRDAQRDWAQLPSDSPARAALVDYAAGVNSALAGMEGDHTLPMYFTVLGYHPARWTPVDSLLVQRLETQSLALDDSPLAWTNVEQGLGSTRFGQWFQAEPQNAQHPYDPGPYQKLALQRVPTPDPGVVLPSGQAPAGGTPSSGGASAPARSSASLNGSAPGFARAQAAAASELLDRMSGLPANAVHSFGNSNEWVVSGSRTASGKPILASDPHLKLSLPSVWFEFSARSPSYDMSGVGLPGIPVVLTGKTQSISWSITNSQHGSTFYYVEKTDPRRPGQYFWDGQWRSVNKVGYTIRVKGHSPVHHQVRLTVHGPIMTLQGVTTSVYWTGSMPSNDLDSMLRVLRSTNFGQFREALRGWHTPAENFAYADAAGNIGIVNAGYAPQVANGQPWLPMSGTGESDVIGSVPFDALPVVYNPPGGVASTANQREVTSAYPYYWGRGTAFFDQGWRESEIVRGLAGNTPVTVQQTEELQTSETDGVARALGPILVAALKGQPLDATQRAAAGQLSGWDSTMSPDSTAPAIWQAFLARFDADVWNPIAKYYKIATPPDFPRSTAQGTSVSDALRGMLIKLARTDPGNPVFSPQNVPKRTATDVLRQAFKEGIADLVKQRGSNPATWRYGDRHSVMIASLLGESTLDAGPYPSGSDGLSINAVISPAQIRNGKKLVGVNIGGASWRFVVDWGRNLAVSSLPGGLEENAASPWYANRVKTWLAGKYDLMLAENQIESATKGRTWTLTS